MSATATNCAMVLYDGQCPLCTRTASILRRLDWFGRLRFHDCRNVAGIPEHSARLDPARMIQEMHVLTPDRTKAYSGFRAVRWIAGRLPLALAAVSAPVHPGHESHRSATLSLARPEPLSSAAVPRRCL